MDVFFGSSSSSSSSRPAENDQRRAGNAGRARRGSDVIPRLAGLSSRPVSPPRALCNEEHQSNREIQNEILPNLINVRDQCANNPALGRTYQRAVKGVQDAQGRLAGDTRTRSRDELAEMLANCRRDLDAFTRTQYQAVEAEQSYSRGESTLLGSQAQIAPDVMAVAMNILYGYQTVINPVQMNEWQRKQVGNLLKDIPD
ncbi:hypothetical protein [Xanthomonas oryzae]|uniref:hypothetical protein n=1 Tax=Xanthomonas oryzae TaxID=347 RepID=UPI003D1861BB